MTVADQIKKLVQLGKLEDGLKMLNDWAAANDEQLHNTTILLLSRFNQLKRNSTMGLISNSEAERSRNQLSYAVLSTVDDLPDTAQQPVYTGAVTSQQDMDPGPNPKKTSKELFISYAREDRVWVDKLETQLADLKRRGVIAAWTDSQISPGQNWNDTILKKLNSADLFIFMVSPNFIASSFINENEVPLAMRRNREDGIPIVPIVVRPSLWTGQPYSQFQALPTNARAISTWANEDEAYLSVLQGISEIVN